MKKITSALLLALVGFFCFKSTAGMMAPLIDKVILKFLDGCISVEELTRTEVEPEWMRPQNPHPIEEHYSVYVQTHHNKYYMTRPFEKRHVLRDRSRVVVFPEEAEVKFATGITYINYEGRFFQSYNVSRPHPIPPKDQWQLHNQGDGRIYVAIKRTKLVYWATIYLEPSPFRLEK